MGKSRCRKVMDREQTGAIAPVFLWTNNADMTRLTVMSERLTKWKKAVFLIYFLLVVYYLRCKGEVAMERFLSERRA